MRRFATITALVLFLSAPALAADAPAWTIDPAHSTISFSVRHIFTPVQGNFERVSGTLRFDPENLEGSRVSVEIPVDGVNTRNERRDGHLKTADFFAADSYPAMRFESARIVRQGDDRYLRAGTLTIHGVSKDVALPFTLLGVGDHPMRAGHLVAGARLEATVKRNDFGVGSGTWAETAVVGDDVTIEISIEAYRPKTAPAP